MVPINIWQYRAPATPTPSTSWLPLHTNTLNQSSPRSICEKEFKVATCTFYPSANQQATVTINPDIWGSGFPCTKDE
ncbi:unnamed protein product [Parnassius apollo]|uniref:(apollo) hypothetical protein n=1 Tax=Parnassius apollo TaxID=110799 RepID=A0A8S3WZK8_PARAO|nr:unnamed protein product [Parnassius apollo]